MAHARRFVGSCQELNTGPCSPETEFARKRVTITMSTERIFDGRGARIGLSIGLGSIVGVLAGVFGLVVGLIISKILLSEFNVYADLSLPLSVLSSTIFSILTMNCVSVGLPRVDRRQRTFECFVSALPSLLLWLLLTLTLGPRGRGLFIVIPIIFLIGCSSLIFPWFSASKEQAQRV